MSAPDRPRVPALGGVRTVPAPDPIARDYLLLALRLDQRISGFVDGYFGPADLKAQVDMEQLASPARLRDDARVLRERVATEVKEPDRRAWLAAQLRAIETQAATLAGEALPYEEHLRRCFDRAPVRRDEAVFEAAAAELDRLLPGTEEVAVRLAAWDDRFVIAPERLPAVVDWLVGIFRARAAALFGLPDGEDLRVSLVRDRPWTGYNWYDGGFRSRVELNLDLPVRAARLLHTLAHETYPGHHLEHARKEAELVERAGRLEASVLLINTPECLVSEGLADVGHRFASPAETEADLLVELFERAGLEVARDPAAARAEAARSVAIRPYRDRLEEVAGNAALLRHADGASHEEVLAYLRRFGLMAPDRAAKRLEFIEHPLWRTYVFVYDEGEALLDRWLQAVPADARPARFGRLLREQLTPSAIEAEVAAGAAGA